MSDNKDNISSEKPHLGTLCLLTRINEFGEKEYLLGMHTKQHCGMVLEVKLEIKKNLKTKVLKNPLKEKQERS